MEKQFKKLSVDFPVEAYADLKKASAEKRITIKELVYEAITQHIKSMNLKL